MKSLLTSALCAFALMVCACSDDAASPDSAPRKDASVDTRQRDSTVDTKPDLVAPDLAADTSPDISPDSAADVGVDLAPDLGADSSADAAKDVTTTPDQSLLADQGVLDPLNSVASCNPSTANQPMATSVYYFRAAQTFTAAKSGILQAIDFSFDSAGKPVDQEVQIRKTVAGEPSGALLAARPVKGYFVHSVVFRVDFSSSNVLLTQGETYAIVLVDKEPISSTTPGKSLSWWGHQQCQGVDGAVQLWKSQNQATLVWTMATNTTKPAASFNVGIDDASADASVDSAATPDAGADLSVDAAASSWDLVRLDKFGGFVHIDKTNGAAIKNSMGVTNSALIAFDGYRKALYRIPLGTTVSTITGVDVCTGLASTTGTLGTIKITGQTVSQINGLAVDPSTGIVYAAADLDANSTAETLITIDPSTFDGSNTSATVVGAFGGINGNQANRLFFANGKLYATRIYNPGTGVNTEVYTVNTSTAVATSVGFLTTALPLTQVAWDPSTSALYANSYSFKVLYKIDLTNLSVTDLGGTALYQGPPIAVIERTCP